jgi:AraC-like DNA-binding protein
MFVLIEFMVNSYYKGGDIMELEEYTSRYPIVPYLRLAGYATRPRPWAVLERKLLDYLLLYVQEGQCQVCCNEMEYDLNQGDFCLVQPDETLTIKGNRSTITPFFHFDIFYNQRREESFPTISGQLDLYEYAHLKQPRLNDFDTIQVPVVFQPPQPNLFRNQMIKIIGLWVENRENHRFEIQILTSELVQIILNTHRAIQMPNNRNITDLNWITSYMTFHMGDPITLKDMAERTNLSVSRFSKIFNERFGMSPYRYLTRLRIDCAKDLLQSTELRLYEISEYCGFANEQHFSKAFVKRVGTPPGNYRQSNKT